MNMDKNWEPKFSPGTDDFLDEARKKRQEAGSIVRRINKNKGHGLNKEDVNRIAELWGSVDIADKEALTNAHPEIAAAVLDRKTNFPYGERISPRSVETKSYSREDESPEQKNRAEARQIIRRIAENRGFGISQEDVNRIVELWNSVEIDSKELLLKSHPEIEEALEKRNTR